SEIVVRAPDGDLGADPMIVSAREGATAPFEIGENAVAPLGVERVYPRFEEIVEIHCQAAAKGTGTITYRGAIAIMRCVAPGPSASLLRDADKTGVGRQQQRAILHVPVAIDRLSRGIGGAFALRLGLDLGRAAAKGVIADPDPLPGGLAGRGRLRRGRIGAERAAAAQGRRRDQQKGGAEAHAVSAKARSRKRPAAIRRASAPIRATSCTPVGRPLSPQIAGSVRQGVPSRVHMRLKTGSP